MSRRHREEPTCPHCGAPEHVGYTYIYGDGGLRQVATPQEYLNTIEPDAAVFFDRDVVLPGHVDGLCGPRFRPHYGRLLAHFGSPVSRYVIFVWIPEEARWKFYKT